MLGPRRSTVGCISGVGLATAGVYVMCMNHSVAKCTRTDQCVRAAVRREEGGLPASPVYRAITGQAGWRILGEPMH